MDDFEYAMYNFLNMSRSENAVYKKRHFSVYAAVLWLRPQATRVSCEPVSDAEEKSGQCVCQKKASSVTCGCHIKGWQEARCQESQKNTEGRSHCERHRLKGPQAVRDVYSGHAQGARVPSSAFPSMHAQDSL
jgi:hypothetical protein